MADSLEKALKRVQHAARDPSTPPTELGHSHTTFSATASTGELVWVALYDEGYLAFHEACELMADDLRLEHMDQKACEAAVQTFTATAGVVRTESHVASFVEQHAQEVRNLVCSFAVEDLVLDRRRELFGGTRRLRRRHLRRIEGAPARPRREAPGRQVDRKIAVAYAEAR
jgi:hypothetical protein